MGVPKGEVHASGSSWLVNSSRSEESSWYNRKEQAELATCSACITSGRAKGIQDNWAHGHLGQGHLGPGHLGLGLIVQAKGNHRGGYLGPN